jgi:hypothetical protein
VGNPDDQFGHSHEGVRELMLRRRYNGKFVKRMVRTRTKIKMHELLLVAVLCVAVHGAKKR